MLCKHEVIGSIPFTSTNQESVVPGACVGGAGGAVLEERDHSQANDERLIGSGF